MSTEFEASTTPSTPPRPFLTSKRTSSTHDTPWNKGSGSHSGFRHKHTQDDYKPYLKEDLKYSQASISFDEFLKHILYISPEWCRQEKLLIEKIVDSKRYQDMLQCYAAPIHHETERYYPFLELVNHATGQLRESDEFVVSFCRNDPIIVKGSYAQRKPDGGGVEHGVVNEGERGGVDNISQGGPEGNAFLWTDFVSFLEFKVREFVLNAAKTLPSEALGLASSQYAQLWHFSYCRLIKCLDHAGLSSAVFPPAASTSTLPRPITTKANGNQSSSHTRSSKRRSKPVPSPSQRITRATANAAGSSTKRTSPTQHDSDLLRTKRAKTSSEQSSSKASVREDLDLQCASYALELLSHGGLRNHVIAAAITDRKIKLLYYDRSIIVESSSIDFIDDDSRFIAMLNGFANLTPYQWGYEPLVKPPHISRPPRLETGHTVSLSILEGQTIILSNGKVLELGKTVYHQHGLIGRGTWVLRAMLQKGSGQSESSDGDDAWNRGLIVKLSRSPKSRKSEDIIISEARNYAKACGDQWVLDHLPNVLHAEDIDRTNEGPVKGLIELLGDRYEPRVLRMLVLEELFPVTELAAAPVLAQAFRDVFKCKYLPHLWR